MKLFPLSVKKKISRAMHRLGLGAGAFVITGAFASGIGGMILYEKWGDREENTALQQKVDHLLNSYRASQSMNTVVQEAEKGADLGFDLSKVRERSAAVTAAFNAEAEQTGIALAHARKISPEQRYEFYKQLQEVKPRPDYFREYDGNAGYEAYILFRRTQSQVMDRPGFTPTVDTAREIVEAPHYGVVFTLGSLFGTAVLSGALVFGFSGTRRRLDKSIKDEEDEILIAREKARRQAEREAKQAQADEAARIAAESAEAERIAKLPPSIELDRDINVRPIRLVEKGPAQP